MNALNKLMFAASRAKFFLLWSPSVPAFGFENKDTFGSNFPPTFYVSLPLTNFTFIWTAVFLVASIER